MRQYVYSTDGNEFSIHVYKPGSFFPIALVLADLENRFYFEAANDIKVRIAQPAKVLSFLKSNPKVLMDFTKRLSRGLFGVVSRYEEDKTKLVEERLLSLLNYLSKNFPKYPTPTHQDLSSWLGVSRETVSRNLKRLEGKGKVKRRGRNFFIYNPIST